MPAMPAVKTTSDLYPPDTPAEVAAVIGGIIASSDSRNVVLVRSLHREEREQLGRRALALTKWTEPAKGGDIGTRMLQFLLGFSSNKSMTAKEAKVTATQYAYQLRDLPMFAIERACSRFESGSVRPEEIGEKAINWNYAPSSAALCVVAKEIARPFGVEKVTIAAVLRGRPREDDAPPTREAVAAVEASLAEFKRGTAQGHLEEEAAETRRQEQARKHRKDHLDSLLRDYRRAGLTPPVPKDGIVTSLPMMLKMGWKIEDVPGGKALVAPPAEKPAGPRETQPWEMGT